MDQLTRWNQLLALLAVSERLSLADVSRQLGVSEATVRRDFDELARQQMLTRTRGGVISNGVALDLPLRYKEARNASEKARIASTAANMITSGSVVGMNGGTTTTAVARALAARSDLTTSDTRPAVTVVTNALNIANELTMRPQVKIVVVGGVARQKSYELLGPLATKVLSELTMDFAILGVDAVSARDGATAHHEGEASINQLMASRARRVIIVADGSKLGGHAFALIARITDVEMVITDSGAPADAVKQIEAAGCQVLRV